MNHTRAFGSRQHSSVSSALFDSHLPVSDGSSYINAICLCAICCCSDHSDSALGIIKLLYLTSHRRPCRRRFIFFRVATNELIISSVADTCCQVTFRTMTVTKKRVELSGNLIIIPSYGNSLSKRLCLLSLCPKSKDVCSQTPLGACLLSWEVNADVSSLLPVCCYMAAKAWLDAKALEDMTL